MIKCFSLPNLRVFNTDAVPTEAGKRFQVQKVAEHAMAASHCSHIHDVHLQLPQAWMHQSPKSSPSRSKPPLVWNAFSSLVKKCIISSWFFGLLGCSCQVSALLEFGQHSSRVKNHHGDWYANSKAKNSCDPTEYWWTNATSSIISVWPGSQKNNIYFARCVTKSLLHLLGLLTLSVTKQTPLLQILELFQGMSPQGRCQEMLL